VLWSLYFNVDNTSRRDLTSAVDNVVVVGGPDELIDYDQAISQVVASSRRHTCHGLSVLSGLYRG